MMDKHRHFATRAGKRNYTKLERFKSCQNQCLQNSCDYKKIDENTHEN